MFISIIYSIKNPKDLYFWRSGALQKKGLNFTKTVRSFGFLFPSNSNWSSRGWKMVSSNHFHLVKIWFIIQLIANHFGSWDVLGSRDEKKIEILNTVFRPEKSSCQISGKHQYLDPDRYHLWAANVSGNVLGDTSVPPWSLAVHPRKVNKKTQLESNGSSSGMPPFFSGATLQWFEYISHQSWKFRNIKNSKVPSQMMFGDMWWYPGGYTGPDSWAKLQGGCMGWVLHTFLNDDLLKSLTDPWKNGNFHLHFLGWFMMIHGF